MPSPHPSELDGSYAPSSQEQALKQDRVLLEGTTLDVVPGPPQILPPAKLWNKTNRADLAGDVYQTFYKSATSYTVLGKDSKLSEQSPKLDANGIIEAVERHDRKIGMIKRHLRLYDIIDVFTVVFPLDKENGFDLSSEIRNTTMHAIDDASRLSVDLVAISCMWWNCCVDPEKCPWVRENMTISYSLLENNTDPSLWRKCIVEYDEYPISCQGGPLMFSIINRHMMNTSEQAIIRVRDTLKTLRIKDLPNEDVDVAVSHIKTVHSLLEANSSDEMNFVPTDLPEQVLTILSSTSVFEFNRVFIRQKEEARAEADKNKGSSHPAWPEVGELCSHAQNMYYRMKNREKGWLPTKKNKSSAFMAQGNASKPEPTCWNCGGNHLLPQCKAPRDEARIERNRKAFMEAKQRARERRSQGGSRSGSGRPAAHQAQDNHRQQEEDSRPMKKNKKGVFVVDQKAWAVQKQRDTDMKALLTATEQLLASSQAPVVTPPAPVGAAPAALTSSVAAPPLTEPVEPSKVPASSTPSNSDAEAVRACLARLRASFQ